MLKKWKNLKHTQHKNNKKNRGRKPAVCVRSLRTNHFRSVATRVDESISRSNASTMDGIMISELRSV